ncbi:flagellar motor switch protein FliN/FliY [Thermosulfidibacter takaii ABI70S6]|uniref:Flagellar motor switch protein FliN n=1 Tax=Thermosulfidibacter takaii (strain DSM 17441 / JCM 13301 / NBRC 103674 / ABI70S6) TaxID=1298851 RepID=A0A0S3QSZ0_THET7|nr:flagellar motor switch protein FliN [Thermosulfidibacter takaii]BAT71448.1 flagellar motor switch protein FliN/FliY [Thermosulfidibacter takaii ABI70S6]
MEEKEWELKELNGADTQDEELPLDFLHDVELEFEAVLGTTKCTVGDLLRLAPGAIVELDRSTGEALDLYLNGRKFAKCEVLVMDEKFGVRITEILPPEEE